MRLVLAFGLLAACHSQTSSPAAASAWSEETFAANVQARLTKAFPAAHVTHGEEESFHVDSIEVQLTKAHDECRKDWAHCEEAVAHTIAAIQEAKGTTPVTRTQLRMILRANEKVAIARGAAKANTIFTKPFSADAQWVLAADLPNTIRYDIPLTELGLDADAAWQLARDNTKPNKLVSAKAGDALVYQDVYAPSALLYPELLIEAVHKELPGNTGNLLAVCPEENIVLYTLGGAKQIAALRGVAEGGAKDSVMPLSTRVMEYTGGTWHEAPGQ